MENIEISYNIDTFKDFVEKKLKENDGSLFPVEKYEDETPCFADVEICHGRATLIVNGNDIQDTSEEDREM